MMITVTFESCSDIRELSKGKIWIVDQNARAHTYTTSTEAEGIVIVTLSYLCKMLRDLQLWVVSSF